MLSKRIVPSCRRGWLWLLQISFLILCLRFQIATFNEVYPNFWPPLVLTAGAFGLVYWRPAAALFAFTISTTLLAGFTQSTILSGFSPSGLVLCAMWMGFGGMGIVRRRTTEERSNHQIVRSSERQIVILITDILISAVLLSLAWQLWSHRHLAGLWPALCHRAVFGFGEPYYFLTSAFLWLQGLFYFRTLRAVSSEHGATSAGYVAPDGGCRAQYLPVSSWIGPMFAVCTIILFAGFLFQSLLHIPYAPRTFAGMVLGISVPFEDFHSFGSVAVAVFAYAVASWQKMPPRQTMLRGIAVAGLFILVIASWSRAAWMAAVVSLLFFASQRMPRKWTVPLVAVTAIALFGFHLMRRDSWTHDQNPFLYRLVNLVRMDQPRLDLYHKAFGLVRDKPLLGHGIGSSYLTGIRFARLGDPLAKVPEFMHNFLLQITTEQGLLVAALYVGLIGFVLRRGLQSGGSKGTAKSPAQTAVFGATVALAAYLITQLTANSLNIYVSNQFFFWFLMAAILCATRSTSKPASQKA